MARLPTPGGDDGVWGQVLNDYLSVSLDTDGTVKAAAVANKANDAAVVHITGDETVAGIKTFSSSPVVPAPSAGTDAANKTYVDGVAASGAPDATTSSKGIVQLAGDLGGTAASPTVPGLAGKIDKSTATTKGDLLAATAASTITRLGIGSDNQVLTADSTQATGLKWAAAGGSDQAWQFRPESYGALGDGQMVGDVATTASSGIITSASGKFTAGDVGKHIMINGALGTGVPLTTTIASYQSANQVTLTATATATASGLHAIWGTDDTAAIQSAIDAAKAYAVANEYYGEVVFKDKYYVVAGPMVQTTNPNYNTQLKIPFAPDNTERKLVIGFKGAGDNSHFQYWGSTMPNLAGTVLVSMQVILTAGADPTYGYPSVLGAPSGNAGFAGSFVNTKAAIENIMIVCPAYTNLTAFDLTWLTGCYMDGCSAHVFATPLSGGGVLINNLPGDGFFQSRSGVGLRLPCIGNNADIWLPTFASEGYSVGLHAAEHVRIGNLKTIYNDVALMIDMNGLSGEGHGVVIEGWTAEAYNGGISLNNGGICHVDIRITTEASGSAYDINDTGNVLHGQVRWVDVVDNRSPVVNGAAHLRVIDETKGPGHWAGAPAVPASTTPQQNTAWRDAAVNISGGTVTDIAVDGTSTGLTSGTVIVPSGKNVTLTYSSAPSWNWTLL